MQKVHRSQNFRKQRPITSCFSVWNQNRQLEIKIAQVQGLPKCLFAIHLMQAHLPPNNCLEQYTIVPVSVWVPTHPHYRHLPSTEAIPSLTWDSCKSPWAGHLPRSSKNSWKINQESVWCWKPGKSGGKRYLYYIILWYIISYYIMLYYIILLNYIISYYIIL
jgi:hypothetical protein